MPVEEQTRHIQHCIKAKKMQNWENFEIVYVDGLT
jgi:hypothetical protein